MESIWETDNNNKPIGANQIDNIKSNGNYFRSSFVILRNKDKILLHRRSKNSVYPGKFGIAIGGKVDFNESYLACAKRELKEEVGINSNPKFLFAFTYEDAKLNRRFHGEVFVANTNSKVKIDKREIYSAKFVSLQNAIKYEKRDDFLNDNRIILRKYLRKAIIFDLNGVLTNASKYYRERAQWVANILGVELLDKHVTQWRDVYIPLSRAEISLDTYHEELERIFLKILPNDFEKRFSQNEDAKQLGIPKILLALKKRGFKLGVLSNYYSDWAYFALKKIKALPLIDSTIISSSIKIRKPDIRAYKIAIKRLGFKPYECLYIGDSIDDLIGASKAGLDTVFIKGEEDDSKGFKEINDLLELISLA